MGPGHRLVILWLMLDAQLTPRSLAHDAVLAVMLGYLLFHGVLATLLTMLQALRVRLGYVGVRLPYEPMVLRPLWSYSLARSEEHTSELQSRPHLVCRLLLEKKKK